MIIEITIVLVLDFVFNRRAMVIGDGYDIRKSDVWINSHTFYESII